MLCSVVAMKSSPRRTGTGRKLLRRQLSVGRVNRMHMAVTSVPATPWTSYPPRRELRLRDLLRHSMIRSHPGAYSLLTPSDDLQDPAGMDQEGPSISIMRVTLPPAFMRYNGVLQVVGGDWRDHDEEEARALSRARCVPEQVGGRGHSWILTVTRPA